MTNTKEVWPGAILLLSGGPNVNPMVLPGPNDDESPVSGATLPEVNGPKLVNEYPTAVRNPAKFTSVSRAMAVAELPLLATWYQKSKVPVLLRYTAVSKVPL